MITDVQQTTGGLNQNHPSSRWSSISNLIVVDGKKKNKE